MMWMLLSSSNLIILQNSEINLKFRILYYQSLFTCQLRLDVENIENHKKISISPDNSIKKVMDS